MRPWIVAILFGWMAILAVLAYVPSPVGGMPPDVADKWLDFGRTLVGSFVGATVAFLFNLWLQHLTRERENLAAGNLALNTLARQLNTTVILQRALYEHRDKVIATDSTTPLWAQMHPGYYYFSDAKFDFQNLSFLTARGDAVILSKLAHVEELYFDLAALVAAHAEASAAVQSKIAAHDVANQSWADMEKMIGLDLLAKTNTFADGIFVRLARNPPDIRAAIEMLRAALIKRFSDDRVAQITEPKIVKLKRPSAAPAAPKTA